MYCSKRGKPECERLPPCKQALVKYIRRASYQTRIWKMSLINYNDVISPDGHGWHLLEEDGKQYLQIDWFDCKPPPDEIRIIVLFVKMVHHIKFNFRLRKHSTINAIMQSMIKVIVLLLLKEWYSISIYNIGYHSKFCIYDIDFESKLIAILASPERFQGKLQENRLQVELLKQPAFLWFFSKPCV